LGSSGGNTSIGPNPRAVDAAAAAVEIDAVGHEIDKFFPAIDQIVAQENFAEARPVGLHLGVAFISLDRGRAAEDHAAVAMGQHGRSDVAAPGIDRNGFGRDAGLEKGRRHAVGRPRLLRTRLEDEADLHGDDGQPKGMYAGRVGRENQSHHGRLRLVADHHAAFFDAIPPAENVEIEPAGQRVEHLIHVGQHEIVLLHVRRAHVLGQAGRGRLLAGEFLRRLLAVAHRQRGVEIEVGRLLDPFDQVVAGDRPQHLARPLAEPHVALEQARVGLRDLGDRLAGDEVRHRVGFERFVGFAPTQDGKV
jgi:hypothetical protein